MSSKTTIVVALLAAAWSAASVSEAGETRSDISLTTCHDLAAERTDADRAQSIAFYLGHYYGRHRVRTIDSGTLPDRLGRVKELCQANPSMRVVDAFERVFKAKPM